MRPHRGSSPTHDARPALQSEGSGAAKATRQGSARVVHVSSVHPPDDPRIFAKECRTLAALGYDVHYVAPTAGDEVRDGVRLWGIAGRARAGRVVRMTATVTQVIRRALALDADVYHLHDPELIPAGLLLAAAGRRVIYDAHESMPENIVLKPWLTPPLRRPLARLADGAERAAGRRFAAVIAATPPIGERFATFSRRTAVVSNFPQLEEFAAFQAPRDVSRERAVCYVGSISELRGARVMVEAMSGVDASLLLAGRFSSPELRDELAALPGWQRVVELGQVGRDELPRMLGRVRAGLAVLAPVPTYVVSQPTKVYEYMAACVPAITSDFPLWRSIVERNRCGICVDPTDPRATADAIRWILDHPEEAEEMGRNGRRAVLRDFRWEREAEKLAALYAEVLAPVRNHRRLRRSRVKRSRAGVSDD
jgi:glycosyltransferase involved in cell wall biosynthesis